MEIEPRARNNTTYITFTYMNRKVRGYILNYDIE